MGVDLLARGRRETTAFAQLMLLKLAKREFKGDWRTMTIEELFVLLQDEVEELKDEVLEHLCASSFGNRQSIVDECVDVANFAMFIADVVGGLK